MVELPASAASLCPVCLQRIEGNLVRRGDAVLLEKHCADHGHFAATVWRGEPRFESWFRPKLPYYGGHRRSTGRGCPFDCGLCEHHTQRTCTALVEITSRCNLGCPVCFADSDGSGKDVDLAILERMFAQVMERTGGCNLQLSGGEPTVRSDLPEIIRMARGAGFQFVQLNTNGLRLADDPGLAASLRDAGLSSVFLQFDGVRDEVFTALRGRKLLRRKRQAIDHLAEADLGVVLVPTVVRGLNMDQLWDIVRFGLERQPNVRGVHFQPIGYFGRFPADFSPDHVTLPELMQSLCSQSGGLLRMEDFRPPGCEHALCSFSAKYLTEEDGRLVRLGKSCDCSPQPAEAGALTAIGVTARQWGPVKSERSVEAVRQEDDLTRFLHRARSHTFSISAMAFQDCWSVNLERLQGCCIHVARPDGGLVPFCSFNLTAANGATLPGGRQPERNGPSPQFLPLPVKRTTVDGLVARGLGLSRPLERRQLEQALMEALRRTVKRALAGSSLYRERLSGLDPATLRTRDDLRGIPLLSAADVVSFGHRLLCVSQGLVARVITLRTSGSTGTPKRLFFTAADLQGTMDFFFHGMLTLIKKDARVLVLLPHDQPDSVGELLLRALRQGGIEASGCWPPPLTDAAKQLLRKRRISDVVGLPQHLLALSLESDRGQLRSMLLCSDYAPFALRRRIEENCGCETFLHYGATETGLGGAVECGVHDGCHIRESELLVEIIDPLTGTILSDGEQGEIVVTTLGRQAMPLLRYRTGDLAVLDRSACSCGGVTARLCAIRGRRNGCIPAGGGLLRSQDLDDHLFQISGLLDYRAVLAGQKPERLQVDFLAVSGVEETAAKIERLLLQVPVIRDSLAGGDLIIGELRRVESFAATHTVKRTIVDRRP
jgi:hypothetical protein